MARQNGTHGKRFKRRGVAPGSAVQVASGYYGRTAAVTATAMGSSNKRGKKRFPKKCGRRGGRRSTY